MSKRKIIFLILFVFILLGAITVYCLNRFILPVKIKTFAQTKLTETLKRDVTIGTFYVNPFKGFIISDIKIYDKESKETFAEVKELSFKVLPIPLLKKKHIIIPSIEITEPFARIARTEGQWNFADLLEQDKTKKEKSSYQLFLKKLSINQGRVDLKDHSLTDSFSETIDNIDLDITLSLDRHIPFSLKAQMPENKTTLEAKGDFDTKTRTLKSFLSVKNLRFAKYNKLIKENSTFDIPDGVITESQINLTYQKPNIELKGNISILDAHIETNQNIFQGSVSIQNLDIKKNDVALNGSANIKSPAFSAHLSNGTSIRGKLDTNINTLTVDEKQTLLKADLDIDKFDAELAGNTHIQGRLQTPQLIFSKTQDSINLKGDITLDQSFITSGESLNLQGQLKAKDTNFVYKENIPSVTADITLSNLFFKLNNSLEMTSNLQLPDFSANLNEKSIIINSLIKTQKTHAVLKEYTFDGSPEIDLSLSYNPDTKQLTYSGLATLKASDLSGLPQIGSINQLQGKINFKNDEVSTENISLILNGSQMRISGKLNSFTDPSADVKLTIPEILLTDIIPFVPENITNTYKPEVTGKTSLNISYAGKLTPFDINALSAQAALENASLISPRIPGEIQNAFGEINYASDKLTWKTLRFKYNEKEYELDGALTDFSSPQIVTSLVSQGLKFNTSVKFNPTFKQIDILSLKGNYLDSSFDLNGNYDLSDEKINIVGPVKTDLGKLANVLPQIQSLKAQGLVRADISLSGPVKDWKNWHMQVSAASNSISLYDYPFTNLSINYLQKDQQIQDLSIFANLYDGPLSIQSTGNLKPENMPVKINIDLDKFNISKWRLDKKIVKKDFGGDLAAKFSLTGELTNMINIKGVGNITVTNAYFKKLIPQYEGLHFNAAQARLNIENQKIRTNDLSILSDQLVLKGKGWLDFQNNLDLNITPVPTKLSKLNAGGFQIDTSDMFLQVASIGCKGKLNKPKCSPEISPVKVSTEILKKGTGVLKEGTGILTEGVGSILDDLF